MSIRPNAKRYKRYLISNNSEQITNLLVYMNQPSRKLILLNAMFVQACHRLYPYLVTCKQQTRNEYLNGDAYRSLVDGGYLWILWRKPSNRVLKKIRKLGATVTIRYNSSTSRWHLFMLPHFSTVVC